MSARPNFLSAPGVWVRTARTAASPVDQACAVHHNVRPVSRTERIAGVMLAVAIGICGAALLAHWAAS
jgi:hypothetical protein